MTTSPVSPTKSPKSTNSFHKSKDSSPTESAEIMICRSLEPSLKVANINFPAMRFSITRPAIETIFRVFDSGDKSLNSFLTWINE